VTNKDLECFIAKIPDFISFNASDQIKYFVYYLTIVCGFEGAKASEIKQCYDNLDLRPYSNIPAYLSKNSSGKDAIFLRNNYGYILTRPKKLEIDELIGKINTPIPSNSYFPLELVKNTRGYIEKVAEQACICYDIGLYDACLVMTRKMLETLIIESFERHSISDKIKGSDGNFYYLSDLINYFVNETKWNLSRNAKNSIPEIKRIADLSAHNRRFIAKQHDVDKIKNDLRIVIEELIHIIDYANWK